MSKNQKRKVEMAIPAHIMEAIAVPPIEYLRKWWIANSTEEERTAADERDATIEGVYAFVEDFSRRAKHDGQGACLPDQVVYDLCGVFMRVCRDGDVYATAEEIAKEEAEAKRREESEAKRKEEARKRHEAAQKKEAERIAAMTDEEREAYIREMAERKAREEADRAKAKAQAEAREAVEAAKRAKREEIARKKALAEEMEARQLSFDF